MKLFGRVFLIFLALIGHVTLGYADINVVRPNTNLLPEPKSSDPATTLGSIISWGLELTAVLAIIAITWSALNMILSTGEDEKFKKARYTMIYAFIGLIIAGLAYSTVNLVVNLNLDAIL